MHFVDLEAQQQRIRSQIEKRILTVLDHGKYIMGPEVSELENKLAAFSNIKHAVACASGTDALLLALLALDIQPGDAVLTTPFTFFATAEVIKLLGAVPVFVDIDSTTFNISPSQLALTISALKNMDSAVAPLPRIGNEKIEITPRAIIAVDLFGQPAEYNEINRIAREHDLVVIEDAAQSFGATYHGNPAGSLGKIACTSFFPAKPLGCYGDGGMCLCEEDALAEKIRSLRVHGKGTDKYENVRIGINGRLDSLQAAILLAKLLVFPDEINRRQEVARRYTELTGDTDLKLPVEPEGVKSVWAQYSVMVEDSVRRQSIQKRLLKNDIPSMIYYPIPLHLQTAFKNLGYGRGDFPVSEDCSQRIFSLPMHPYLTMEQQEKIADIIADQR